MEVQAYKQNNQIEKNGHIYEFNHPDYMDAWDSKPLSECTKQEIGKTIIFIYTLMGCVGGCEKADLIVITDSLMASFGATKIGELRHAFKLRSKGGVLGLKYITLKNDNLTVPSISETITAYKYHIKKSNIKRTIEASAPEKRTAEYFFRENLNKFKDRASGDCDFKNEFLNAMDYETLKFFKMIGRLSEKESSELCEKIKNKIIATRHDPRHCRKQLQQAHPELEYKDLKDMITKTEKGVLKRLGWSCIIRKVVSDIREDKIDLDIWKEGVVLTPSINCDCKIEK